MSHRYVCVYHDDKRERRERGVIELVGGREVCVGGWGGTRTHTLTNTQTHTHAYTHALENQFVTEMMKLLRPHVYGWSLAGACVGGWMSGCAGGSRSCDTQHAASRVCA